VSFFLFAVVFCANDWMTSPVRGVTGGSVIAAPTGVIASDSDYANKVGISWDTIRGATIYRIFRNTINDPGSATDVGTTAKNFFFDPTAVVSQNYFYWVRAENGGSVSEVSAPDQGMRAPTGGGGGGPFTPLEPPFEPAGNPITATKAYLGKTLFWDEQLSSTRTVSCGTCHRPGSGGADPRSLRSDASSVNPGPDGVFGNEDDVIGSKGVPSNNSDGTYGFSSTFLMDEQVTGRLAPSYLNAQYSTDGIFWDGRALPVFRDPVTNAVVLASGASLESQSTGPPVSGAEMAHAGRNWTEVAAQIEIAKPLALAQNIPSALETWIGGRTYPELFEEAFGDPAVTPARIAMAIATHERTLFSDRTPFDRAIAGIQPLTAPEAAGRQLFVANSCNFCHDGSLLSDQGFHNIGVRPQADDAGRYGVTGVEFDRGSFRTPSLRNVELRAAFMHNGRFETLQEVVDFYARGGDFDAPNIDHGVITPRAFTPEEVNQLVAFMGRPLTDLRVANETSPFDRPTLYTESANVPIVSGAGRAGTGGETPDVTAIEPPLAGNPSFTIGVSNVIPGTQAVLVIDSVDPGVGASIPATGSFAHETVQTSDAKGNGYASVSLSVPATPDVVGQTFLGRWYVTDAGAANGFAVSPLIQFTVFGDAVAPGSTRFDFDGDAKTDVSIFRPGPGEWWYLRSSDGGNAAFQFGSTTDTIVPADYTGDGKTDIAFFRPSTGEWFILRSEDSSFYSFPFGGLGDIPAPGDFDGDGIDDPTIFRPSSATWFSLRSSDGGFTIQTFGAPGDQPTVEDFDGDGMDDIAIYRPSVSEWWQLRSTQGVVALQFGSAGDQTVPADYTGDGKADIGFFRPSSGEWFILRSEDNSFFSFPFGGLGDIPAAGDYDGDGTADAAVFRPSTTNWFINGSQAGTIIQTFGAPGDVPVPNAYVQE